MTYALIGVHTDCDLLASTINPAALLATAQRLKIPHLAVIDQATTLAHVPLAQAAHTYDVHVTFGATLPMAGGWPIRILARTEDGYRNLCRLVSAAAQTSLLSWDFLRDHRRGLYILCGGRSSRIWRAIAQNDPRTRTMIGRLQAYAERDDQFVIECQRYEDDSVIDGEILRQLLEHAEQSGARCIATHDVHVLHPEDGRTHRLLQAIAHHTTFFADDQRLPPWQPRTPSRYRLPEPATWYRSWDGLDHLVAGSAAVLRDCQVELLGRRRFPGASLPAHEMYDQLWKRAFAGLRERYAQISPDVMSRLYYEIAEVTNQGVTPFLVYAAELVARAAARGIPMILTGSGTGSLLCFALGISAVDPAHANGLVFERFAGVHRGLGDLPDLDFAIPAGREHEVRAILEDIFGAERVAFLTAIVTFGERGATRTAAQAFGWDTSQIRVLREKHRRAAPLDRDERMISRAAAALVNRPAHLMRHSTGVVIADEPLHSLYGVSTCADGPLLLADRDDVELLQLLKFDLIASYALAIYEHAKAAIHTAIYPVPDLWHITGDDARTGTLLEQADTRAIPYLQSPAMLTLLRALKVRTEADLAVCLGALRPGASQTRPRLLAAIHGGTAALQGWEILSPEHQQQIEDALAASRGAFIFDEDLLHVVHTMGLSYADAERLRKAIKRGSDQAVTPLNTLRAAALNEGWRDDEIDVVIDWLTYVQRYTFARGHALAIAHVAWRVAHIAAHYPGQFLAAVLDQLGEAGGGMYPSLVYVTEVRRNRLDLVGPTVNSPWISEMRDRTIQCGLAVLKGVIAVDTLQRIANESRVRPFCSIMDFRSRVHVTESHMETLISVGALDTICPSRRHARWMLPHGVAFPSAQARLLDLDVPVPAVEPESRIERAWEELQTLGWTVSTNHPLDLYADLLPEDRIAVGALARYAGQTVSLAGIVVASRRIRASNDQPMAFLSVCDESGTGEVALVALMVERYAEAMNIHTVLWIVGEVSDSPEHGLSLIAQQVQLIAPAQGRNGYVRSSEL